MNWSSFSFRFGIPGMCSYCGDSSSSIDHVIPISLDLYRNRKHVNNIGITTFCCQFCNSSKSDRMFNSYYDILMYIRKRNLVRFRRVLYSEPWTKREAMELDYSLRSYILSKKSERDLAKELTLFPYSNYVKNLAEEAYSIALIRYPEYSFVRNFFKQIPQSIDTGGIGEVF